MKFNDRLEARVERPVARRVRAEAKGRNEKPAFIIREALAEYFAKREAQPETQAAQPVEQAA